MIDANLYTFLTGNTAISTVVANRVYPEILPEKPMLEAITFRVSQHDIDNVHGGSTGFVRSDYFIDTWGATHGEASALAKIVRNELKNLTGSFGGITVQQIFITMGPLTIFENMVNAYRITQIFSIWHGED